MRKFIIFAISFSVLLLFFLMAVPGIANEMPKPAGGAAQSGPMDSGSKNFASLNLLLVEAEENNPSIRAAREAWQAAGQIPTQVSTLPDPQFVVQQFSVGSPVPFSGYTTSDFAYVGFGVSQDLPFPGKLRLRGKIAEENAEVARRQFESVRLFVLEELKTAYFHLAYLSKTLGILENDGALLKQVEESAKARYEFGRGNEQDLFQAQLEETKLLEEITENRLKTGKIQAEIKRLLNRSQDSPDLVTEDLSETPLIKSYDELLAAAQAQNPGIAGVQSMVKKSGYQVDLAKKDFYPDFNLQYMVQRTDPGRFPAYYMLTLGVRLPIHPGRRQKPELEEAKAQRRQADKNYEAEKEQVASELRGQYVVADQSAQLLKLYREGLRQQSRSEFAAGLAAYEANREDFQTLLVAFLNVLQVDEEYWKNLADHETAIAGIEEITGISLREIERGNGGGK